MTEQIRDEMLRRGRLLAKDRGKRVHASEVYVGGQGFLLCYLNGNLLVTLAPSGLQRIALRPILVYADPGWGRPELYMDVVDRMRSLLVLEDLASIN